MLLNEFSAAREPLLEANVRNVDAVVHLLTDYAARAKDTRAKNFILRNVRRWLVNNPEALVPVARVFDNDPEWARQAFAAGDLYDFQATPPVLEKLEHFVHSLNEITDERPQLLDRILTLDVAGAENVINEFYQRRVQTDLVPVADGETVITQYPDGYRWVQMETPEALSVEGKRMGHCVGGYGSRLQDNSQFYSYRDLKNRPHITLYAKGKHVVEVKGRGNRAPIPAYIPRLIDFLNLMDFANVPSDLSNYDIVKANGKYKLFDVNDMKPTIIDGFEVRVTAKNIYVRDNGQDVIFSRNLITHYDPRFDLSFYRLLTRHLGGGYSLNFIRDALAANLDAPGIEYELNALHCGQSIGMEGKVNVRHVERDGIDYYAMRDNSFLIKDGDKIYSGTLRNEDAGGLPLKLIVNFALMFDVRMGRDLKMAILASVRKPTAEKLDKRLKVFPWDSQSMSATSPFLKRLPDNLHVSKTLFLRGNKAMTKLPDGLVVGRDVRLADTNITKIGDNTTIKRVLDLRGSKVKRLPKNLTVGGKLGSRLDLRDSLIKSIPDDLVIVTTDRESALPDGRRRRNYEGRKSGGVIVIDRKDIKIPQHLKKYVRYIPKKL